jgi:hypothetical protein
MSGTIKNCRAAAYLNQALQRTAPWSLSLGRYAPPEVGTEVAAALEILKALAFFWRRPQVRVTYERVPKASRCMNVLDRSLDKMAELEGLADEI